MTKAYTDLEQSKRLAEFLPLDSADMVYIATDYDDNGEPLYIAADYKSEYIWEDNEVIHCWSLAALLSLLPNCLIYTPNSGYEGYACLNIETREETFNDNNLIDCCVEMIIELHNKELL